MAALKRLPSVWICPIARAVLLCAVLAAAGCSLSQPPQFRLNTEGRDPGRISLAQREAISAPLEELFGTPDEPKVPEEIPPEMGLRLPLLRVAAGPIRSDAQGNQRGLYRQHCASCHGISGDGAGPAAAVLNPYPRDFRDGLYKYKSTKGGTKPVWEDLDRGLRFGTPDTAMPAFNTLPDEEIDALIEYVKYLSIRGATELFLLREVIELDSDLVDMDEVIDEALFACVLWAEAVEMVVEPPRPPPAGTPEELAASIDRGYELYSDEEKLRCFTCHGPNGEGDGEQSELYDEWNERKRIAAQETKESAGWFLLPIQRLRPRDFTKGIFRGGGEPIDVYWRIYAGIKGTPMPSAGRTNGTTGVLKDEEIWDVVNYVRRRAGKGGQAGIRD